MLLTMKTCGSDWNAPFGSLPWHEQVLVDDETMMQEYCDTGRLEGLDEVHVESILNASYVEDRGEGVLLRDIPLREDHSLLRWPCQWSLLLQIQVLSA